MVKGKVSELNGLISKLEVDAVGIVSLADYKGTKLEEMASQLLPSAQSIVIVAMEVFPEVMEHGARGKKIADTEMKSLLQSHYDFLSTKLAEAVYDVARACRKLGFKALPLAQGLPYDKRRVRAVFSYKHAAQAAGMGTLGRSSLLITPEFGPRVRLACCLTEAVLKPTRAKAGHKCGKCRICIDGCPAGALAFPQGDEPYSINKFACNSYRAEGYCSECLRICPAGK